MKLWLPEAFYAEDRRAVDDRPAYRDFCFEESRVARAASSKLNAPAFSWRLCPRPQSWTRRVTKLERRHASLNFSNCLASSTPTARPEIWRQVERELDGLPLSYWVKIAPRPNIFDACVYPACRAWARHAAALLDSHSEPVASTRDEVRPILHQALHSAELMTTSRVSTLFWKMRPPRWRPRWPPRWRRPLRQPWWQARIVFGCDTLFYHITMPHFITSCEEPYSQSVLFLNLLRLTGYQP